MTELDAVNDMLAAIGEAPVTSLTGPSVPSDSVAALAKLTLTTREVCQGSYDWNVCIGLACSPIGNYTLDGTTYTVYAQPDVNADILWIKPSRVADYGNLALALGLSTSVLPGTPIVRNRVANQDGFPNQPDLIVDCALAYSFDVLPAIAQRYVAALAKRDYLVDKSADRQLVSLVENRVSMAAQDHAEHHGLEDRYSALQNPVALGVLGAGYGRFNQYATNFTDPRIRR